MKACKYLLNSKTVSLFYSLLYTCPLPPRCVQSVYWDTFCCLFILLRVAVHVFNGVMPVWQCSECACVRGVKSCSGVGVLSKPSAVGVWLCALKTIIALCSGKRFPLHDLHWSWHCIKITCWIHISLPQPCNYIFDKREERGWRKA